MSKNTLNGSRRKVIKTSGDKFKTENLSLMGGKGLFVKEIEKELLSGNIDCAVHSLKDIPTFGSEKLVLGAYLKKISFSLFIIL